MHSKCIVVVIFVFVLLLFLFLLLLLVFVVVVVVVVTCHSKKYENTECCKILLLQQIFVTGNNANYTKQFLNESTFQLI